MSDRAMTILIAAAILAVVVLREAGMTVTEDVTAAGPSFWAQVLTG